MQISQEIRISSLVIDMEKLHDVKNRMHAFYIAYLNAFVPEGERQLLFSFFSTGYLIILKKSKS